MDKTNLKKYWKTNLKYVKGFTNYQKFEISSEGFGTVVLFINFIVSIFVSSLTLEPTKEIQGLVENIRSPLEAGNTKSR